MRKINRIFIHCSGSKHGNFNSINNFHKSKGWGIFDEKQNKHVHIGYHWYICGRFESQSKWLLQKPNYLIEGMVIKGRSEEYIGAHVKGENSDSIGICYGGMLPTPIILMSLQNLILQVLRKRKLNIKNVLGHYEIYGNATEKNKLLKTCPNINMNILRASLKHLKGEER